MADMEHHVGLENEDVMGQQAINNPNANDDAEGEVNDDILRQALAEASGDNSFYHDNMSAHPNTQETENASVIYTNESGDNENHQTQLLVQTSENGPDAPLGSRANPIRIIQQGNQYTSMQQLTNEQISQIMQVLHQQQIARSSAQAGGSTVVYNSDNNTRVVYRIIYPNELHKNAPAAHSGSGRPATSNGTGGNLSSSRKGHRKRKREGGWDEVSDNEWVAPDSESEDSRQLGGGPELSKEEKEERKKHRPRTRSGRVSKPPKYMVKDYKHIHPLDWDEDYDDSDGGYSDFKLSDKGEDGDSRDSMDASVYSDAHKKIWKCLTCYKSYIGPGGLGRHYRLNPDHGSLDEHAHAAMTQLGQEVLEGDISQDSLSKEGQQQQQLSAVSVAANPVQLSASDAGEGSVGFLQKQQQQHLAQQHGFASRSQQPQPLLQQAPAMAGLRHGDYHLAAAPAAKKAKTPGYVPTGRPRGRPPSNPAELSARRKLRLRDLVRQCETDDLVEVVLPLLIPAVSCWDFLLMRCEESAGRSSTAASSSQRRQAGVADVLREFDELRRRVARAAGECLRATQATAGEEALETDDSGSFHPKIQIESEPLACALGLSMGSYEAEEGLQVQSSLLAMQSAQIGEPADDEADDHADVRGVEDGKSVDDDARISQVYHNVATTTRAPVPSSGNSAVHAASRVQMTADATVTSAAPTKASLNHHRTAGLPAVIASTAVCRASDVIYTTSVPQPLSHPLLQHGVNAHSLMPPAAVLQSAAAGQQQRSLLATQQQQQQTAVTLHSDHASMHQQEHADDVPGAGDSLIEAGVMAAGDMNSAEEQLMAALEGQVITLCGNQLVTADGSIVQLPEGASVVQTREGIVIYHPAAAEGSDGSVSVQMEGGTVMGDDGIPLETVQALLAVDHEGNTQIQYVRDDQGMQQEEEQEEEQQQEQQQQQEMLQQDSPS